MNLRRSAVVAAVGALALVSISAWLTLWRFGGSVTLRDAYGALEADRSGVRLTPEADRLAIANALAESDPPAAGTPGPRLHPPGTLARLRYETFDIDGVRIAEWEVRALVPPLPAIEGGMRDQTTPLVADACSRACQASVADAGGTLLPGSGTPGIAAEWVRRMPVGQTIDLGSRSLVTQDVLDEKPRRTDIEFRRVRERSVPEPANIRVTLVNVCHATVLLGSSTALAFHQNAIVPIPRGFETTHWVQMNGCGRLEPFPVAPEVERRAALPLPPAPDIHVERAPRPNIVAVWREPKSGFTSLRVNEDELERFGHSVGFRLEVVCRYEPDVGWQPVTATRPRVVTRIAVRPPDQRGPTPRTIVELPREPALFWARWADWTIEDEPGTRASARSAGYVTRAAFAPSGPVLCNDIDIASPPAGMVRACVPLANRAVARFVPDPASACRDQ